MVERIDPDCNISEAEALRLLGVVARGVGSINYMPNGNGKGGWRDWVLGVTMLLAGSGIGGVILMYGDQSRLSQAVIDLTKQTDELKHDVKELTSTLRSRP